MRKSTIIIGMFGVDRGCGVTHSSLLLASYLRKCLRKYVAYIECNQRDEIKHLFMEYKKNNFPMKHLNIFRYSNLDIYQINNVYELQSLFHGTYDYCIVDYGECMILWDEFIQCDLQFLIGSGGKLKQYKVIEFMDQMSLNIRDISVEWLLVCAESKLIEQYNSAYDMRFNSLSYNPNPFCPLPSTIQQFNGIFIQ